MYESQNTDHDYACDHESCQKGHACKLPSLCVAGCVTASEELPRYPMGVNLAQYSHLDLDVDLDLDFDVDRVPPGLGIKRRY